MVKERIKVWDRLKPKKFIAGFKHVPNHCSGALGYVFRPEERVPPTGPATPLPAASGLPSRN
jgi:hypothetical protein